MKFNSISKRFSFSFWATVFLPIQFLLFRALAQHPDLIGKYYYPYFFNPITFGLRTLTAHTNLSIGILCFYVFICCLFVYLVKLFFFLDLKWHKKLQNLAALSSIIYFVFMIMWGINYHRNPIQNITKIDFRNSQKKELIHLINDLTVKCNSQRKLLSNEEIRAFDSKKYFQTAAKGFQQLAKKHPEFNHKMVSTKYGFNKAIFSYLNTGGIYFPFSAEANINAIKIGFDSPFTICHEMSHQLGFASEQEANYLAFLACQHNPNLIFKYSANLNILYYALNALANEDKIGARQYYNKLDPIIKADSEIYKRVLNQYDSRILDFLSSTIYDVFLKANNQDKGIKSYGMVVNLMIGEYRKNKLIYNTN